MKAEQVKSAPQPTRFELFQQTGRIFVTVAEFAELEDLPVQRFASRTGSFVHEVREHNGLECTCPGWRKYAKCWHMRWVVAHSVGTERRIGTFLKSMPSPYEQALNDRSGRWASWLDKAIAVVRWEEPPEPSRSSALSNKEVV